MNKSPKIDEEKSFDDLSTLKKEKKTAIER